MYHTNSVLDSGVVRVRTSPTRHAVYLRQPWQALHLTLFPAFSVLQVMHAHVGGATFDLPMLSRTPPFQLLQELHRLFDPGTCALHLWHSHGGGGYSMPSA